MKFKQSLGHNALIAIDDSGKEIILTGKGISFSLKKGDHVPKNKMANVFTLKKTDEFNQLAGLLEKIHPEFLDISNEIIQYAKGHLDEEIADGIYLSLTDHVAHTVERVKKGYIISNLILWEVKNVYPKEFSVGLKAIALINKKFNVELGQDEAAFIATHFVNFSTGNNDYSNIKKTTKIINEILNVIKYHYKVNLDPNSWYYNRFINHLKYFINRSRNDVNKSNDDDKLLLNKLIESYPNEYECVEKINLFFKSQFNREIYNNEKIYLIIHLNKVVQKT